MANNAGKYCIIGGMSFFTNLKKRGGFIFAVVSYLMLRFAPFLLLVAAAFAAVVNLVGGVGVLAGVLSFGLTELLPPEWLSSEYNAKLSSFILAELEQDHKSNWLSVVILFFLSFTLYAAGVLYEIRVNELVENEMAENTREAQNQPPIEQGGAKVENETAENTREAQNQPPTEQSGAKAENQSSAEQSGEKPSAISNNKIPCMRKGCQQSGKLPSEPLCKKCLSDWQKQMPLRCARCGGKDINKSNHPLCKQCYQKWMDYHKQNNAVAKPAAAVANAEEKPAAAVASAVASSGDFRSKFPAIHRTDDGHLVRSKAEMLIDNYLYRAFIAHAYERKLPVEEDVYCDFYLPEKKVYIEYWGWEDDPAYLKRKEEKLAVYKRHGFRLIQLRDNEVQKLDDCMPRLLLKYGIKVD